VIISELKRIIKEELDLTNYSNLKLLHKTHRGYVYQLDNGNILKITKDPVEFNNAEILIKNPSKFFAKYFTAKKLNDQYYELTMEKLTPLSEVEWDTVDLIQNTLGRQDYMLDPNRRNQFIRELKANPEYYEDFTDFNQVLKILETLKMMYQEAQSRGITLMDLRAQNLAKNSEGRIVHFDLGSG
jgi:hypothetical protein